MSRGYETVRDVIIGVAVIAIVMIWGSPVWAAIGFGLTVMYCRQRD